MELPTKRVNVWNSEKNNIDSVEFWCDDVLIFEDQPGPEIEARIEGFCTALEELGREYTFDVEDEF